MTKTYLPHFESLSRTAQLKTFLSCYHQDNSQYHSPHAQNHCRMQQVSISLSSCNDEHLLLLSAVNTELDEMKRYIKNERIQIQKTIK